MSKFQAKATVHCRAYIQGDLVGRSLSSPHVPNGMSKELLTLILRDVSPR